MPGLATAELPGVLSWGRLETRQSVDDSDAPPIPQHIGQTATPALLGCLWGTEHPPSQAGKAERGLLSYVMLCYAVLREATLLLSLWEGDLAPWELKKSLETFLPFHSS